MFHLYNYFFPPQPVVPVNGQKTPAAKPTVNIKFGEIDLSKIVREDVEGVPEAFTLSNIMSAEECKQFLIMIEQIGSNSSTDKSEQAEQRNASNSKGFGISDCKFWKAPHEVMKPIWERVKIFFPESLEDDGKNWKLVIDNPLNEKFRYYCYDAGYLREKHFDGCFLRNTGGPKRDQSHYTLLIYLNEGFEGGETTFFPGGFNALEAKEPTHKEVRVNPKMGHALIFRQTGPNKPLHEGSVHHTTSVRKCLLRSDVMYAEF